MKSVVLTTMKREVAVRGVGGVVTWHADRPPPSRPNAALCTQAALFNAPPRASTVGWDADTAVAASSLPPQGGLFNAPPRGLGC